MAAASKFLQKYIILHKESNSLGRNAKQDVPHASVDVKKKNIKCNKFCKCCKNLCLNQIKKNQSSKVEVDKKTEVAKTSKNLINSSSVAQREMKRRIDEQFRQLLSSLDELNLNENGDKVISATNRPDSLDPALRRPRHFHHAIPNREAKTRILATVPDVTWDDVGSLQNIRQELQTAILAPVKHFEQFDTIDLTAVSGVLLYGPPGCGKTMAAKAIANEAGINFISIKGAEVLHELVDESEKAIRQYFLNARNSMPCVIFFDKIDVLCPIRRTEGDNTAITRIINQILTEMDGVKEQPVFLLAASSRPDLIDPVVLRPGRLEKNLHVHLPNASDRVAILRAVTNKNATIPKLASDVDLYQVAYDNRCEGCTGADLAALIKEASMKAMKEIRAAGYKQAEIIISMRHIFQALDKIQPLFCTKKI